MPDPDPKTLANTNTVGWDADRMQEHVFDCHALIRSRAAERERIVAALNLDGASLGPGSEATTDDILRRIAEWRDDREQAWAELAELRAVVEELADAVDAVLGMDRAATHTGHKPRLRDNDRNKLEAASKQAAALAAKEASRG